MISHPRKRSPLKQCHFRYRRKSLFKRCHFLDAAQWIYEKWSRVENNYRLIKWNQIQLEDNMTRISWIFHVLSFFEIVAFKSFHIFFVKKHQYAVKTFMIAFMDFSWISLQIDRKIYSQIPLECLCSEQLAALGEPGQGILMQSHGFSRKCMGFPRISHAYSRNFMGFSWNTMDYDEKARGFNVVPSIFTNAAWNFNAIPYIFTNVRGILMTSRGLLRKCMGLWWTSMNFHEKHWVSMNLHGFSIGSMDGIPWKRTTKYTVKYL